MTADIEPRSLSEITQDIGWNMSDVAVLSGLDESTVCRLWDKAGWLDRISGRSLQSLMASVPGIAEYCMEHSILKRRDELVGELQAEGLSVDLAALETSTVAQQHLLNALEAALHIVRNEATQKVSSFLARFWGREQDRALEALYSTERGHGLLKDPCKLVDSSIELVPRLNRKTYSFHSILALNILTHQVSKVTGAPVMEPAPQVPGRQTAFMMRGVVMGLLISSNDLDLAERYRRELDTTPVYAALEEWSFPTYTHDGRTSSDFVLPASLLLRNTAAEVLREISSYNEAYLYYLASTYLPLALQRDLTFGSRIADLTSALELRGADCRERRAREACGKLVRQLKGMP
ncbi:hypothetical protein [Sphaerisporangium corydalis]|uniref:XRE family transcriptional regulator n=1 Tax=Sphaerisporangium corydalis TaxID=1441875 RepID=A0ABV9EIA0_9ACTN|nr:hypothetical protein [Sphaerisporangium corydalis]